MSRNRRVVGIERLKGMVFRRQDRSIPGDIRESCMHLGCTDSDERFDLVGEEEGEEEEDGEKDPMAGVLFVVILLLAVFTVSSKRTRSSILVLFSFDD
jgi:hypothetical protein